MSASSTPSTLPGSPARWACKQHKPVRPRPEEQPRPREPLPEKQPRQPRRPLEGLPAQAAAAAGQKAEAHPVRAAPDTRPLHQAWPWAAVVAAAVAAAQAPEPARDLELRIPCRPER